MMSLTLREQKILRSAGLRQQPTWRIWIPGILGCVGGGIAAVASLVGSPQPDVRGIAYGLTMAGFLTMFSAMLADRQQLLSLIAKLRDADDFGVRLK